MLTFLYTVLCLVVFLMVRNMVAFWIRTTSLNRVSALANKAIDTGDHDWHRFYDRYETPSYDAIMFNPLIWTARQAYPWLYEEGEPSLSR